MINKISTLVGCLAFFAAVSNQANAQGSTYLEKIEPVYQYGGLPSVYNNYHPNSIDPMDEYINWMNNVYYVEIRPSANSMSGYNLRPDTVEEGQIYLNGLPLKWHWDMALQDANGKVTEHPKYGVVFLSPICPEPDPGNNRRWNYRESRVGNIIQAWCER